MRKGSYGTGKLPHTLSYLTVPLTRAISVKAETTTKTNSLGHSSLTGPVLFKSLESWSGILAGKQGPDIR